MQASELYPPGFKFQLSHLELCGQRQITLLLFPSISVSLTKGETPAHLPGLLGKWDTV